MTVDLGAPDADSNRFPLNIQFNGNGKGRVPKGFLRLHGWVEGVEVSLSSKVKGQVIQLHAEEGAELLPGQLVAAIDSEQVKAQIANAEAEVARAREAVRRAGDDVGVLESRIGGAKIALELAKSQSAATIAQAEAEFDKAVELGENVAPGAPPLHMEENSNTLTERRINGKN